MTAREFIEHRFSIMPEERDEAGRVVEPERFVAVEAGDLDSVRDPYGLASRRTLASSYMASVDFFVAHFGPTFEAAWASGKRGTELRDALLAVAGGTGWDLYILLWYAKGLFD